MSLSIQLGNFLYKRAFWLYKPTYAAFKNRQDAFEIDLLKKYVRHGDTVLDIGANIGFYALLLSKLTGDKGKVHCFEPDALNFQHLKAAVAGHSNITINNKAAGPESKTLTIYTSKNLNVDHRTYKPDTYDEAFDIEAVSMDDYVKQKGITQVDFIKMDIQGFEMQAIQGMKAILAANPELKLVSEFWPYGLKKAGSSVTEYFNFLTAAGFHCYLFEKNALQLLDAAKVKALEPLGEAHYFNIFATRSHV